MTVGRRIFLSFFALLLVPVALIGVAMGIVRAHYEGLAEGASSTYPLVLSVRSQFEELNRRVLDEPESLLRPEVLAKFSGENPLRGAAVVRDGAVASAFPKWLTEEVVREAREAGLWHGFASEGKGRYLVYFSWNFAFPDGRRGTFLVVGRRDRHIGGGFAGLMVLAVLVGILVLANGGITWLAAGRIIRPLRSLEKAAERIGSGDLDCPVEPAGDREVRRVFEAFETMRRELKASLDKQLRYERGRRELVAALSHDLRTPITAIRGYVEGLRDGIPRDEEARRRYLAIVDEKARLLDRLIGDLFLFSRMELPGWELRRENLDAAAFVRGVLEEVRSEHPSLRLSFLEMEGVRISADRDHLGRALVNVAENSVRHGGPGERTLSVSVEEERGFCRIRLADDGRGIAEGEEERIFEGLYRGDASRNQRDGGSGLGLAVVRQVTAAHGGRVRAERLRPRGLAIVMELPLGGSHG